MAVAFEDGLSQLLGPARLLDVRRLEQNLNMLKKSIGCLHCYVHVV